jgi:hypothetical protein
VAALLLLVLTPLQVLDFEVDAAAVDLTAALKALATERGLVFPIDRIPTLYLQVDPANATPLTLVTGRRGFQATHNLSIPARLRALQEGDGGCLTEATR